MKKITHKYTIAEKRGTALTKTANYTLTEADILKYGYSFIILSNVAQLVLPTPSAKLAGVSLYVHGVDRASVYAGDGFAGGGEAYDVVNLYHYDTREFWCDGTYWYVIGATTTPASKASSSSSSCRSSSSSSSSSCRSSSSSSCSSSSSSCRSSSSSSSG